MNAWRMKLEALGAAVAFAERGDARTSYLLLSESRGKVERQTVRKGDSRPRATAQRV